MDEHLADCATCHEIFAETLRFALDEEDGGALPRTPPVVLPFVRRPAFRLAAILAVAASVFLAFQQLWLARSQRPASPLVAELAQAMGTQALRRAAPDRRLPARPPRRAAIGRRRAGPRRAVAGRPRRRRPHPRAHRGRHVARGPGSPRRHVSRLGRRRQGRQGPRVGHGPGPEEPPPPERPRRGLPRAREPPRRARRPPEGPRSRREGDRARRRPGRSLVQPRPRPRAAPPRGLRPARPGTTTSSATRPRPGPTKPGSTSRSSRPAQQSTLEEDRARARAAVAEGQTAIDRLADETPSILSDYFANVLLRRAGPTPSSPARRTPRSSAPRPSSWARPSSERPRDALPRDAALRSCLASVRPSRDPPRSQALGYKALREAQRLQRCSQQPSCDTFRESRRLLQEGGSPYAAWARERVVVVCLFSKKGPSVLPELTRIEDDARQKQYGGLLGRALWMTALSHSDAGDFDRALQYYRLAQDVYRALRDPESGASVAVRLAYVLSSSGDNRAGWREGLRALALLGSVKQASRREDVLFLIAVASWQDRLARSAVHALTELAEVTRRRDRSDRLAYALIWRGQVLHALGQEESAAADLAAARSILSSAGDMAYAEQIGAFADAADGRMSRIGATRKSARVSAARAALLRTEHPCIRSGPSRGRGARAAHAGPRGRSRGGARCGHSSDRIATVARGRPAAGAVLRLRGSGALRRDGGPAAGRPRRPPSRPLLRRAQQGVATHSLAALTSTGEPASHTFRRLRATPPRWLSIPFSVSCHGVSGSCTTSSCRIAWWRGSWIRRARALFRLAAAPDELERRVAGYAFAIESEEPVSALRPQAAQPVRRSSPPAAPGTGGARFARAHPGRFSAFALVCQPLEPRDRTLSGPGLQAQSLAQWLRARAGVRGRSAVEGRSRAASAGRRESAARARIGAAAAARSRDRSDGGDRALCRLRAVAGRRGHEERLPRRSGAKRRRAFRRPRHGRRVSRQWPSAPGSRSRSPHGRRPSLRRDRFERPRANPPGRARRLPHGHG